MVGSGHSETQSEVVIATVFLSDGLRTCMIWMLYGEVAQRLITYIQITNGPTVDD